MKLRISIDGAAHSFPTLVDRVKSRGEEFIIEQAGRDVCQIVRARPPFTARDLVELLRGLPKPDHKYLEQVEALANQQPHTPPSPWDH